MLHNSHEDYMRAKSERSFIITSSSHVGSSIRYTDFPIAQQKKRKIVTAN